MTLFNINSVIDYYEKIIKDNIEKDIDECIISDYSNFIISYINFDLVPNNIIKIRRTINEYDNRVILTEIKLENSNYTLMFIRKEKERVLFLTRYLHFYVFHKDALNRYDPLLCLAFNNLSKEQKYEIMKKFPNSKNIARYIEQKKKLHSLYYQK